MNVHGRDIAETCRARFFELAGDCDIVVTANPLHVGYLTGYRSILLDADRTYRVGAVVSRDRIALITGASDGAAALEVLDDPAWIYRYGTFFVFSTDETGGYAAMPPAAGDFMSALKSALTDVVPTGSRVLVDAMNKNEFDTISQMLPASKISEAGGAFRRSRMVKTQKEIAMLSLASRITDTGIARAATQIAPGATELDVATVITSEIIRAGGIPRFTVVTAGERSSRVDAYATHQVLTPGSLVRIDIGATFGGYWSDMARTFVVGEPTSVQASRYDALLAGMLAQLDLARPGVTPAELYEAAMETVCAAGLPAYQRNHCGHGIGLSAHEYPAVAPGSDAPIEEGMVFCFETPYYEMGWGGMMVEDTVVITADGHTPLTNSDRSLIIV